MVKTFIKIALALLVLHGAFRVGNAYWTFYRFEDSLKELAQFGDRKTEAQLCDGAMDSAASYGVPIAPNQLFVRRGSGAPYNCQNGPTTPESGGATQASSQLTISGAYTDQLQLLPGYFRPWEFTPDVKVWVRP
jgi:hypothetical protein